jgi:hypothetical protein
MGRRAVMWRVSNLLYPRAVVGDHRCKLRKRLYFLLPGREEFFFFNRARTNARDESRVLPRF